MKHCHKKELAFFVLLVKKENQDKDNFSKALKYGKFLCVYYSLLITALLTLIKELYFLQQEDSPFFVDEVGSCFCEL